MAKPFCNLADQTSCIVQVHVTKQQNDKFVCLYVSLVAYVKRTQLMAKLE